MPEKFAILGKGWEGETGKKREEALLPPYGEGVSP